jgi:hypothetical protein
MKLLRVGSPIAALPLVALAVTLIAGSVTGRAQETGAPTTEGASLSLTASIHEGICGALGAVVASLSPLTVPAGPHEGPATAVSAAMSIGTVPLTLDELLAGDHAVTVQAPGAASDGVIACGEIGGVRDEFGALLMVLRAVPGTGDSAAGVGIAFLGPSSDDADTDIVLIVTDGVPSGTSAQATTSTTLAAATPVLIDIAAEPTASMPAAEAPNAMLPGDAGTGAQD